MKKITINGEPAKKGKNFSKLTRGERWELLSPTNRHLKGYFVAKYWHSGTEFVIF
jgi:hypothetical protein